MGKKGGKKAKIDKAVENAEPTLPVIHEEQLSEKSAPQVEIEPVALGEGDWGKRKSILKTTRASKADIQRRRSTRSKSIKISEEETKPTDEGSEDFIFEPDVIVPTVDTKLEGEKKQKKEKKGKKEKKEKPEAAEGEQEEKPKKGKKGKKEKGEAEEAVELLSAQELRSSVSSKKTTESAEAGEEGKAKKKGKKGKAEKEECKEEGEEKKTKKEKKKKEQKEDEAGEKETKAKQDRAKRASKLPDDSAAGTPRMSTSERRGVSITELPGSAEELIKKKKPKPKAGKARAESMQMYRRASFMRDSVVSEGSDISDRTRPKMSTTGRGSVFSSSIIEAQRRKLSKISGQSSDSSLEDDVEREGGKKEKGKKGKKQKGVKKEEEEETEEERERKRAEKEAAKREKEAEKKEKKAAAKAAKKEAEAKRKEKFERPKELTHEDAKKKVEELKRIMREMDIEDAKLMPPVEGVEEQAPKKKGPKKEKVKMTAEMAERAKIELEAQAKRLEELIKKRKEEDRLAAIEKDRKDMLEQGWRLEQLQATSTLIQEIVETNAEINKGERDLLEWRKYVECGKLPNAAMCDQMNTYLHVWDLGLEKTSMDEASDRTKDVLELLSQLDELIDTVTPEESYKLENWKWIRKLFREYQSASLDVATYRLLRDVESNLNRINIPTADFNFKDDYVTLCIWLRVMLPIPLPNPRRPPKARIDISFKEMDMSVLFPATIDCNRAAIRAMYLNYDHVSDLCHSFHMPAVPEDYYLDLLTATKKEWRMIQRYKYDNRDKTASKPTITQGTPAGSEQKLEQIKREEERRSLRFEDPEIGPDDEIPWVPFKQLKPSPREYVIMLEDQLYNDTRTNIEIQCENNVMNLRRFVVLGGVIHLNLLAQPPQPQDFITMEMTITGLYLPKKLEVLPFKVIYTPYIPSPESEPVIPIITTPTRSSRSSMRKLPDQIDEEAKKQEDELDKLILINVKWPLHVIFLELPIICRWDEEENQWSTEEIIDVKHNEDKCTSSFRTGVFGIYALATYRFSNLPFQAYDIKPEIDKGAFRNSWQFQLTLSKRKVQKASDTSFLHAGSETGFVANTSLIFKSGSKSGDYHDAMNAENFEKWFQEQLLPNLEEPSLIVMDNASYHSRLLEKIPNSSWSKQLLLRWLQDRNIEYPNTAMKIDLWNIVKKSLPEKKYIDSVTVQLTAAILMLEFNIKDGLIAMTQLQNSPNMTLQDIVGKYMKLHTLKWMMKEAGIDIFPAFDSFCYVEGCCEKQWAMEQHLYYNMALISNTFNFAWSRWNLQVGRRKIVLQMRQYAPEKGKQKNHQMLLVTPARATFIDCTEVSQAFSDKEAESFKYCADLYHLMKISSGIFVRNKISKASKQNIYTLAQFLTAIRILSFS